MPWNDKDALTPQALNSRDGVVFNVKDPDFGAVGDGVTDDTAAIKAAITAAKAATGGATGAVVTLPRGRYVVSSEIQLPNYVALEGQGQESTWIIAASTFAFSGKIAVVSIGETGSEVRVSDVWIRDLRVNANAVANSVGIYTELAQEGCGLKNVGIANCARYGFWSQPAAGFTPANYFLQDLNITFPGAGLSSAIAIKIDAGGEATIRGIDGVTINGRTGIDIGIDLDGIKGVCVLERMHFEACDPCIRIGNSTACEGIVVIGANYQDSTDTSGIINGDLVRVESGCKELVFMGLRAGDHTNAVNDLVNSFAVTDDPLGFYHIGRARGPLKLFTDGDATPSVQDGSLFLTTNTGSTTINNFPNGVDGQRITILIGDVNTTILDNSNFRLAGQAAFAPVGEASSTISFERRADIWYEVGRSDRDAGPTYTITGDQTDRTYDADSTTLDEIADVLATLIADIRAKAPWILK